MKAASGSGVAFPLLFSLASFFFFHSPFTLYIYNVKYLSLAIFALLFLSSCEDKTEQDPADTESKILYRYFPLQEGAFVVYHVDSIIHSFADDNLDNPDSLIDTISYEVKEVIDSDFIDGEGDVAWRISRYQRAIGTLDWYFTTLWTAKLTSQSAQKVEENIRYVKLSFPIKKNKTWNGNLFNFFPEEDYSIEEANVPLTIGGFNFDSCVSVLELDDSVAIHKIYKQEKYVYGLGLVYRQRDSLNIENYKILNGIEFRQSIIDYSPR
ncbi:hypothetical protein BH11BAC1_BH11BAC1_04160 [soil metagenome]